MEDVASLLLHYNGRGLSATLVMETSSELNRFVELNYLKGIAMKKLIALACLGFLFAASAPAFAGAQQDKMKMCNKDAKEKALKGDERKAFMKECLSKKADAASAEKKAEAAPADKKSAQQEKMKNCNKEAKEKALKGDERKKFMSGCLKG